MFSERSILAHAALIGVALLISSSPTHADTRADKALVQRLYTDVFNGHDLAHVDRLLAPDYKQHNPGIPTGREGFVKAFTGFFAADPTLKANVKRMIAEDGLVVVHSHWTAKDDARGQAVVDIFRVAGGRIVEHWDVVQNIPKKVADPEALF